MEYDHERFREHKILPSLYHGLWDGCQARIHIDDTVDDVIIHDKSNYTYISVKETFNGVLDNEHYVKDQDICIKKVNNEPHYKLLMASCNCDKCIAIFDDQYSYAFMRRRECTYKR